jgi:hypothetical protein
MNSAWLSPALRARWPVDATIASRSTPNHPVETRTQTHHHREARVRLASRAILNSLARDARSFEQFDVAAIGIGHVCDS